jgi:uncharacterized alkaline shock family protein YloU
VTTSRTQQGGGSPLQSERGATTIQDAVVVSIAAMAIRELDGLDPSHGGTRLPGDTSPTIGEFVDRLSPGAGRTRGISVEVGEEQTALDLTVNVMYGRPIHEVAHALRQNVIRRVESLTGLEVTEVNIRVNDVTFSE